MPAPPDLVKPSGRKVDTRFPLPPPVGDNIGVYKNMVFIASGPFEMGSPSGTGRPDEHPEHKVFLKRFFVAKHEVTAEQYCRFLNQQGNKGAEKLPRAELTSPHCPVRLSRGKYEPKPGQADKPMVCVSWYGARDFAVWAGGRLPTEAEWEKATKATTEHPPGDFLTTLSRKGSSPVIIAIPGKAGVSGLVGNVWEWCSDWYSADYYAKSPASSPVGPPVGEEKVIRGGSWAAPETSRRIANRHSAPPGGYFRTVGFRVVKD